MTAESPESPEKPAEKPQFPRRFEGKVALVTGASDRGIGGAIATRLAREGAAVSMLADVQPARLLKRMERFGDAVLWTTCDLRHQDQIDRAIAATLQKFGRLNCVVNNAGIEVAAELADIDDAQWQQVIDVNLTAVFRMTRSAVPHLEAAGGGVIVNITSIASLAATVGFSIYSASKAGVLGMTRSLALELAPKNIRVVAVAPAMVKTPMAMRYVEKMTEEVWQRLQACNPLGIGSPQDVAAAVAFLASDEARWITGITLPLGWLPSYPLPAATGGG